MSECLEFSSSMTGSTNSGLVQPQKDSLPLLGRSSPFDRYSTPESLSARHGRRQRPSGKMTLTPPNGQPIQLTPLWEHVVRTRRFPNEIDTRLTFLEISERLRDPEWEVRQHALRVLIDVLPTLNVDVVDKVMQPVVPELINNLGHPAPAVRKGALDALRVYLIHSRDREESIKKILQDGLNRSEARDPYQTNITTGVILSAPSLLFPSSNSPSPPSQLIKDTTIALASRLAQVAHQEAVLKSLMKIRDAIGPQDFENYLADYDNKLIRNIEILSKIYNVKPSKKTQKRLRDDIKNNEKYEDNDLNKKWDSDSDTSGIAEEEDEVNNTVMPAARVVLETEIKFNEETAITMTILEEKEDSEKEQDEESGTDVRNDLESNEVKDSSLDRRKTPRRVHFGGESVQLRTPDSDETESVETAPKTRIPLPVSPATKMPRRPSSQPCSPRREKGKVKRASRSVSNSPKREVYTHNAELSPKKSILTRTSSPVFVVKPGEQVGRKKKGRQEDRDLRGEGSGSGCKEENPLKFFENCKRGEEGGRKEEVRADERAGNVEDLVLGRLVEGLGDKGLVKDDERGGDRGIVVVEESGSWKESSEGDGESVKSWKKQVDSNKLNSDVVGSGKRKEGGFVKEDRVDGEGKVLEDCKEERGREKGLDSGIQMDASKLDKLGIDTRSDSHFRSEVDEKEESNSCSKMNRGKSGVKKDVEIIRKDESKVVQGLGGMKAEACGDVENEEDSLAKDCAVLNKRDDCDLRRGDGERVSCSDRDKKSVRVMERSRNLGVAEVEGKSGEQSWEELGLVDQEVLEDLHNKEDWRARVRGLERVASALRTSSALIAIEPRLGSLLHAVLGCERSCRVAAAGLAVAKVVVAGVSEEALKKRLPQLAWGLARQGGPSAAQLARIAMLRLRPVLLLEQLLQAQCLNARNAKTRENALQLLIFSLVTFPSTEFKVDTVANKVAKMVGDRRRRVRQAALDTLAVLAQIYEPEEVLTAGKRAAEGRHDGEAMISAIRARLARKSLPLVSADGLVVYGLQISPTVQIATGPDVDWIVAGSGSVSPGTGRTKGQIIATSSEKGRVTRNANTKNRESPWIERPNFVALGVGMHPKVDQPVAWQIVPTQNQESTSKTESRIPVLSTRDRVPASSGQGRVKHTNYGLASANSRRRTKDALESTNSLMGSREEKTSSYGAPHQRRKRYYPENSESRTSTTTQILDHSYDSSYNYYPVTGRTQTDIDDDYRGMVESTREEFSEMNSRSHQKFTEKERFLKKSETKLHGRSNSTESCQRSAPRNIRQQTVLIQDMYNSMARRDRTFKNEDSFRQLQTAPTPLTRIYNQEDFSQQMDESNDRNNLSRTRFYRRTKDAVVQKIDEVELISSDAQTNGHYPPIFNDAPCRRRLRSLSPSQLYRRQQFVRGAGSNELHAISMYDIDKAVNEEEYNERNKHHFLPEPTGYHVQTNSAEARFPVDNRERILSKSASSSSSDVSKSNRQQIIEEDVHDRQDFSDSRSSTPQSQDVDPAFDIITNQSSPSNRDTVDSFVIPLNENLEAAADATITSIEDDTSKDWSSEDDVKLKNKSQIQYVCSEQLEYLDENRIESEYDAFGEIVSDGRTSGRRRSVVSVLSSERILTSETLQAPGVLHSSCSKDFNEIEASPSRIIGSPEKTEALYSSRSPSRNSNDYASRSPSRRNSCGSPRRLSFSHENEELEESGEERVITSILCDDTKSVQSLNQSQSRRESKSESPTIIIASRPHSNEAPNYPDNNVDISTQLDEAENAHRGIDEYSVNEVPEDRESKDSASETNTEPAILKIETHPVDPVIPARKMPSRVPRGTGKFRANGNKGNSEKPEKSKPVIQQCFSQLESKDWEITMKGLKTLSQIAKQHPEYLDACAAGTIGRFLGRHIKNLRSQVARAACLAAGDVFSSQIRGIDQDIDDIAGPLLHRTADTNRFLRADSNAALDHMVQHLPPHKTIGIIVQRGASHQNAIVRAATARLLAEIVDRVGPEHTMILPKDVRDKLLNTGARLLIDGNLDARNHAKRMFRRLTRCDGFRRALTDAVPETTLRHIDKTLKSL